jgi:transcriptional regulator NrdR family protein
VALKKCTHETRKVIDSRPASQGTIRRRCRCIECGYRWTTYEVPKELWESLVPFVGARDRIALLGDIIKELDAALSVKPPKVLDQ